MANANIDNDGGAATSHGPRRVFTMLENNPEVMNALAWKLGMSKDLSFYDVYSLYDADMLALVPRPVYALLTTVPMSPAWKQNRTTEDGDREWYKGAGPDEPVLWFRQTLIHGCGLIGLLHCLYNGIPTEMIDPGSQLANFREKAIPLKVDERAQLLKDSEAMYEASQSVAYQGDSNVLTDERSGDHFVALVKGQDGNLWELEGSRKGPLNRGSLGGDEDALSERALDMGIRRLIQLQRDAGHDLGFSCIALGPTTH